MFVAALGRLRWRRGLRRANDTKGAVLLRADETYQVLPALPLSRLRRLIGRETIVIDIRGTNPSKPTVLIVANEGEGPKRFNRRATKADSGDRVHEVGCSPIGRLSGS